MRKNIGIVFGVFLFFLSADFLPASAQEMAGITGIVTDKTGAAVSDADVKLVNSRNGTTHGAKTGSDGVYRIVQLAPGPGYTLTVSKDGFQTVSVSNLYLAVATSRSQDVRLDVGTVNQTVEVKSEGSVSLNTSDGTIGNNFDMRTVASLPNEFRDDPANLLRLQPGVVSAQVERRLIQAEAGTEPSLAPEPIRTTSRWTASMPRILRLETLLPRKRLFLLTRFRNSARK